MDDLTPDNHPVMPEDVAKLLKAMEGMERPKPFSDEMITLKRMPRGEGENRYRARMEMYDRTVRNVQGDPLAERMWNDFQREVRDSLDERVLRGFDTILRTLRQVMLSQQQEIANMRSQVVTERVEHKQALESLAMSVRTLLRAYEGAVARDSVEFMEDEAWEADSALAQYTGRSVLDLADVDADSADGRSDVASPDTPD